MITVHKVRSLYEGRKSTQSSIQWAPGVCPRSCAPEGIELDSAVIWRNGDRLNPEQYDDQLNNGDHLHYTTIPKGLAALLFGAQGWTAFFIDLAIMAVTSWVMKELMLDQMKQEADPSGSSTYGFAGVRNPRSSGEALPVVYGEHMVAGLVINTSVEMALGSFDEQQLTTLYAMSEGPIEGYGEITGPYSTDLEFRDAAVAALGSAIPIVFGSNLYRNPVLDSAGVQINGQNASNFSLVGMQGRTGELNQEYILGFGDARQSAQLDSRVQAVTGITETDSGYAAGTYSSKPDLSPAGTDPDPVTHETTIKADRAIIRVNFPRGLYKNTNGDMEGSTAKFRILFYQTDGSGTATSKFALLPEYEISSSRAGQLSADIGVDLVDPDTYEFSSGNADYMIGGTGAAGRNSDEHTALTPCHLMLQVGKSSSTWAAVSANSGTANDLTSNFTMYYDVPADVVPNQSRYDQNWTFSTWAKPRFNRTDTYSTTNFIGGDFAHIFFNGQNGTTTTTADIYPLKHNEPSTSSDTANIGWENAQAQDGALAFSFWCASNNDVRLVFTHVAGRSDEVSGGTEYDRYYVSDVIGTKAEMEGKWSHVAIQIRNYDLAGVGNLAVIMYADGEKVHEQTYDCETGDNTRRLVNFYHDGNNAVNYANFLRFGHCHMPFGYGSSGSTSGMTNDNQHAAVRSYCKLYNIAFFEHQISDGYGFGLNNVGILDLAASDGLGKATYEFTGNENYLISHWKGTVSSGAFKETKNDTADRRIKYHQSASVAANPTDPPANPVVTAGEAARTYYKFEIARSNPELDDSQEEVNYMEISEIVEIQDEELEYPHTATMALLVGADEQINNSAPKITATVKGRTVVRWTDNGGEFVAEEPAFTSNPAWIALDALTNERYGVGAVFGSTIDDIPDRFELDQFIAWAAYCDDGVADGFGSVTGTFTSYSSSTLVFQVGLINSSDGSRTANIIPQSWIIGHTLTVTAATDANNISSGLGADAFLTISAVDYEWPTSGDFSYVVKYSLAWTSSSQTPTGANAGTVTGWEKRARYDGVLGEKDKKAWDAIVEIFQAGRAMPIKVGQKIGVHWDRARSPVAMFTMANILEGSLKLRYMGTANSPNSIEADILDRQQNYERVTVQIDDPDISDPTDLKQYKKKRMQMRGVTRRSQAIRDSHYQLRVAQKLTRSVEFDTGLDSVALLPGDVFILSHDVPDYGTSGRILKNVEQGNFIYTPKSFTSTGNVDTGWLYTNTSKADATGTSLVYAPFGGSEAAKKFTSSAATPSIVTTTRWNMGNSGETYVASCYVKNIDATDTRIKIFPRSNTSETKELRVTWTGTAISAFTEHGASTDAEVGYEAVDAANMLCDGEQFASRYTGTSDLTKGDWFYNNLTFVEDGQAGPLGYGYALRCSKPDGNNAYLISQIYEQNHSTAGPLVNGKTYTASCYVKNYDAAQTSLNIWDVEGSSDNNQSITISWASDGTATKVSGAGTVASVGKGWYRIQAPITIDNTEGNEYRFEIKPAGGSGSSATAGGTYVWGAMLNEGSSAATYSNLHGHTDGWYRIWASMKSPNASEAAQIYICPAANNSGNAYIWGPSITLSRDNSPLAHSHMQTVVFDRDVTLTAGSTYEVSARIAGQEGAATGADLIEYAMIDRMEVPQWGQRIVYAGTPVRTASYAGDGETDGTTTHGRFSQYPLEGDLYALGKLANYTQQFAVTEIQSDPQTFIRKVKAIEYDSDVYLDTTPGGAINASFTPDGPGSADRDSQAPRQVIRGLVAKEVTARDANGVVVPAIEINWSYSSQQKHKTTAFGKKASHTVESTSPSVFIQGAQIFHRMLPAATSYTSNFPEFSPRSIGSVSGKHSVFRFVASGYVGGRVHRFSVCPQGPNGMRVNPAKAPSISFEFAGLAKRPAAPTLSSPGIRGEEGVLYGSNADAQPVEAIEWKVGGWILGQSIAEMDGSAKEVNTPSIYRLSGYYPDIFARARLSNGQYGIASSTKYDTDIDSGTDLAVAGPYFVKRNYESNWASYGTLSVLEADSAGYLRFPTSGSDTTGTYITGTFDMGEARRMHCRAAATAHQRAAATVDDMDFTVDGPEAQRWTAEGPTIVRSGETANCTIKVEWSHSATASPGTDYRPFKPGMVYFRTAAFRITVTRPSNAATLRIEKFGVFTKLPADWESVTSVDGGTF